MNRHFHVSKLGKDTYSGSMAYPFKTIQHAADVAGPGDTITVHEGTYREYVDPKRGGKDEKTRLVFEAAEGERVVISGAEKIEDWEWIEGTVYKTVLPNSFFGDFNPYKEIIWGDWFEKGQMDFHLGEVYINGRSLYETDSLEKVKNPELTNRTCNSWERYTWYCETDDKITTIYANFGEYKPKDNDIEINVRRFCFWPQQTGINYITVRGFHLTMAATNWAPPTALQEGLIGPHWSRGWIIENNEISNSKNSGISLGKEIQSGHNKWVLLGNKSGTQRERDVIMNALHHCGWNKETIGSHIVRNNEIHDCEQTGICGHLGAIFSEIYGNHIYNIHHKRQYNGAEIAGIKLHAAIDCQIRNNFIHDCDRGIWMDWQAQGVRISSNTLFGNDTEDLFVEVSHGPYIVDNNIFLSMKSLRDQSQGGAYCNNLFAGFIARDRVPNRFTPYHYAHETGVHGFMTILGGDNRFYNNIFTGTQNYNRAQEEKIDLSVWMNDDVEKEADGSIKKGLCIYNEYPSSEEDWYGELHSTDEYANAKLPMYCGSNLYLGDAQPYKMENGSAVCRDINNQIKFEVKKDGLYINLDFGTMAAEMQGEVITTEFLGEAFESELPFENADGTPLCIELDFFGKTRDKENLCPGPFCKDHIKGGKVRIAN